VAVKVGNAPHQWKNDGKTEQVGGYDPSGPLHARGAEAPLEIVDYPGQDSDHDRLIDGSQEYAGAEHRQGDVTVSACADLYLPEPLAVDCLPLTLKHGITLPSASPIYNENGLYYALFHTLQAFDVVVLFSRIRSA
jgi:hypothetical protein